MPPEGLVSWPVDWPAPDGVRAFMSTRHGGVSQGAFGSLNLGLHVGDDQHRVIENRQRLALTLGAKPLWLNQVHGARVVNATEVIAGSSGPADGAWSTVPGQACTVLVADCLPVLLCSSSGRAVAAAHAGWRGLAAGVLDNAVQAVCRESGCAPEGLMAWLGPCIGPRQFEVGDDVLQAFGHAGAARFRAHRRKDGSPAWLCDLSGLAQDRLRGLGVNQIYASRACTVEQASDFFSFRRDRSSGRMAAVIFLDP
jgi:polyphenol oxidase